MCSAVPFLFSPVHFVPEGPHRCPTVACGRQSQQQVACPLCVGALRRVRAIVRRVDSFRDLVGSAHVSRLGPAGNRRHAVSTTIQNAQWSLPAISVAMVSPFLHSTLLYPLESVYYLPLRLEIDIDTRFSSHIEVERPGSLGWSRRRRRHDTVEKVGDFAEGGR